MSKSIKKTSFNDFLKELQANSLIDAKKKISSIEERRYFLIVCEGEKTEPTYFEYFKSLLPRNLVTTIEIQGEGDNTINVVEQAVAKKEERKKNSIAPPFDEAWAVFDKDDFPDARFNKAVRLAKQHGIKSAHSNQSFELWYVLHFQNLQSALNRKNYIKILSNVLGFKYKKNDKKVVEHLFEYGDVQQAIKWAQALEKKCEQEKLTAAKSCPMTRVYELVENLLVYCQHESVKKKGIKKVV